MSISPAAQNVTVDEIISAYRQACQKLNCKPIPTVLKQIQVNLHSCLNVKEKCVHVKAGEVCELIHVCVCVCEKMRTYAF